LILLMVKVDPPCLTCPIGPAKCIGRAQRGKRRKLRRLYPGHPWTIRWCPLARGYAEKDSWFDRWRGAYLGKHEERFSL